MKLAVPIVGMVQAKWDRLPAAPHMKHSCSCSRLHPVPWKCSCSCPALGVFPVTALAWSTWLFFSPSPPHSWSPSYYIKLLADPCLLLLDHLTSIILLVCISQDSWILYCLNIATYYCVLQPFLQLIFKFLKPCLNIPSIILRSVLIEFLEIVTILGSMKVQLLRQ